MPTLRLVTLDVRSVPDTAAVGSAVAAAEAHVACLRHAPTQLRWRSKAGALARLSGMVVVGGGRPASGNLIICSLAVDAPREMDVPLAAIAEMSLAGSGFTVVATSLDAGGIGTSAALKAALDAHAAPELPVITVGAGTITVDPRLRVVSSQDCGPASVYEIDLS